ncbi:MAG: DNA repair exonuclease, partial [Methanomassiliicoccales archaeon]|nr:DNA repair exonuclease [Methanomassiliicoccales archaeon]
MGDSFRFIHCSDLHLGCRFSGISDADEDLGRRLRESVFTALDNIVSFAKKEKVDFVIFSGDIFDSTNETPLTRSRFADAIASMKVPCYIIYGNHDTKRRWENSIPLPKNAFVFPEQITHMYFEKDGRRVTELIGMSFPSMKPNSNYVKSVKKESDLFAIGVFHCNVDGAKDDNYSPCKLSDMKD